MLTLLGYGPSHRQLKKCKKARKELKRCPLPPSPIQQMKDIAGMSDVSNVDFVAWFKKVMGVFENIHLINNSVSEDNPPFTVSIISPTAPRDDPPFAA